MLASIHDHALYRLESMRVEDIPQVALIEEGLFQQPMAGGSVQSRDPEKRLQLSRGRPPGILEPGGLGFRRRLLRKVGGLQ